MVPGDERPLPPVAAAPQVELQRGRGRDHRPPAALPRRDAPLLHDRGGPGGPGLLQGATPPRLLEVPQASLSPRIWFMAARARTLPAAIAPVLVGSAAAADASDDFRWGAFAAALVGSIFIQIGTNLANDYSDAKRGADTEDRLGPVRVTSAGLVAPRRVLYATWLAFGVAVAAGIYLATVAGWVIIVVGAASIAAGVLYTGGPRPYGYAGMGELFVFLFFGLVAVNASYYVQAEELRWEAFALSLPVGLLAAAILVVNNVRDVDTDRRAGKRTLAVKLGRERARLLFAAALGLGFAAPLLIAAAGGLSWWLALTVLAWVLAPPLLRTVLTRSDGQALNGALAAAGGLLALFSLLLSAGVLLS